MAKHKQIGRAGKQGVLQGQAGVWATAAQLALRGHVPFFPGVDYGYDLVLENGLRIQVKTSHLISTQPSRYFGGAYCFNLRRAVRINDNQTWKRKDYRTYEGVADFFVLWGIDENRFWIVPTSVLKHNLWFGRVNSPNASGNAKYMEKMSAQRAAEMENRWDLLDVNAVKNLVDSAASEKVPVPKEN